MTIRDFVGDYFGADLIVPRKAWRAAGLMRRDVDEVGELTIEEAEAMVSMTVTTADGECFQANLLNTILTFYEAAFKRGQPAFERRWRLFIERSKPVTLAQVERQFSDAGIVSPGRQSKPSKFTLTVKGRKIQ
jgi:hypothetical protein